MIGTIRKAVRLFTDIYKFILSHLGEYSEGGSMGQKKLTALVIFLALALMLAIGIIIGMKMNQPKEKEETQDEVTNVSKVVNSGKNALAEDEDAAENSQNTHTDNIVSVEQEDNDSGVINEEEVTMTAKEKYGALSVKGSQLVDKNGGAVQLRGVSTHGLSWYPQYATEESFRYMRDEWNINVVRLAMYTAEENGYCVGDDNNRQVLKNVISEGVNAATNLGLYVIIDWHILSDSNPLQNKEQAIAFFDEMSSRYQGYDNVIYEICNEPNVDSTWQDVKTYANEVIPVIRKNDQDAIILVGTTTWSQDVDLAQADPLTGYENIMYVCHFYAATHKDDLRQRVRQAAESGLPMFVSEFGICDASGNGGIDTAEADKWIDLLNEKHISFVAWNLSNKDESSAFFKVNCDKTSGYTEEDLSDSAKWFIQKLKK